MGVPGRVGSAAINASPVGGVWRAAKGLTSVLGLGNKGNTAGPQKRTYQAYLVARDAARAGDLAALQWLGETGGVLPGRATAYMDTRNQAARAFRTITIELKNRGNGVWPDTAGTAPPAEYGAPAPTGGMWGGDAQAAPKPRKPCAFGPRDPETGRCPPRRKRPAGGSAGASGGGHGLFSGVPGTAAKPKRPCAYGPRDADGRCPPKGRSGKLTKRNSAMLRRAETAAANVLIKGGRGAIAGIRAGLAGSGLTAGAAAAAVAAVVAAAAFGWMIGQEVNHAGETREQRKVAAALDANHARKAMAEALNLPPGEAPPQSMTREIDRAYKQRIKLSAFG